MFFLAIITHPLLDAQTTWGTQLFWPFEWRIAIENIFIIDPIYTLPFLIFLILTAFQNRRSRKRKLYNSLGLILSSAYLLITLSFKGVAHYNIAKALDENNIEYIDINTRATYFNSVLWSSQIELEDSYMFTYYSLFDKSMPVFTKKFPKNHDMLKPFMNEKKIQQLIILSNGHYLMTYEDDVLIFWNLKLGLKGFDENASPYIWSYVINNNEGEVKGRILSLKTNDISDRSSSYFDSEENLTVYEIVDAFEYASDDIDVELVFLDLSYVSVSSASAQLPKYA